MSDRLSASVVATADAAKILGIRAGARSDHRFIGVWPIVVEGRLFARSWSQSEGGWYRTVLEDPVATIEVGRRRIRVRVARIRSARLLTAIDRAYAAKYPTPGSAVYVRGLRSPKRRATTVEFVPAKGGKSG